jgi:mRNA interferase HigB
MHVIAKQKLRDFYRSQPQAKLQLEAWWKVAKLAKWADLVEVQKTFKSAEAVGRFTVFNVCGNKYRLIVHINYGWGRIYVRHVLTHAEYDKGRWKHDPYF